jgi:hypothetical protein
MTNPYTLRAKGIYVEDKHGIITAEDLKDEDFIICKIGDNFTKTIQAAYDADIPIIMFVRNELNRDHVDCSFDESKWPWEKDPQVIEWFRMIYSNGVKRIIQGVMVDCTKTDNGYGRLLTPSWITAHGQFIMTHLKEIFGKKNVFLWFNNDPIKAYAGDSGAIGIFNQFMIKNGVSTVDFVDNFDGIYPTETERCVMPYDNTAEVQLYFWLYGVVNNRQRIIYSGDKNSLYTRLGFVKKNQNETPEDNEENDGGVIDNNSYQLLNARLDNIELKIDKSLLMLNKIGGHFVDPPEV